MEKHTKSCESDFMSWLSTKVPPAQLSELYWCYAEIESSCTKAKILHNPLFETTDTETIHSVQRFLEQNKMFHVRHLRQFSKLTSAGRYYLAYITENAPTETEDKAEPKVQPTLQMVEGVLPTEAVSAETSPVQETAPEAEKSESGEETKPGEEKPESEILTVNFDNPEEYTYTKPCYFSYFEERKEPCSTWKELYVTFFTALEEGYPHLFHSGMSFSVSGGRIELATRSDKVQMFAPKPVPGTDYIIETNISASHIVRKMKYLLDLCAVDYENVVIKYTHKTGIKENAAPKTDSLVEAIEPTASEIDTLLSEEIFSPLRCALAKENIRTMEELKALKLWAFMNQNNIYSISMRQTVLEKVRRLLDSSSVNDPKVLYVLDCETAVYTGNTIAKAFLHFCEDTAKKYPLLFRSFLDKTLGSAANVKIYRSPGDGDFIQMENPTCYISADLAKDSVIAAVEWMIRQCTSATIQVTVKEPEVTATCREQNSGGNMQQPSQAERTPCTVSAQKREAADSEQIAKAEKVVLDADMDGITCDSLHNALGLTLWATKALVRQCNHIVEIKDRLYHEDAFIDWDDGAKHLCLIMEKLMQKNNGYISAAQLYDYARAEMNMFLNDNDVNDERAVYEIAQHLFEKNCFEGHHYTFVGKTHISKSGNIISNNFDIICKFAADQGGVFRENDLVDYLAGLGIHTGNLRNQMRLNKEPVFFVYEPGTIISAKSMRIDDLWKESVGRALNSLLDDADGHIILRQIQPVWYESLPVLPGHRPWTPLLLQFVLRFYGKEFGAKTIRAMEYQSMDTLHAMLVKDDSPIQNFGDAVISYLIESGTEQRSFKAEQLRRLLVKTGMIQGNELIWNMPKALAKDERFAWDASGENVTVRM